MKKCFTALVGLLMTGVSFGTLSRFECTGENENKFRKYSVNLDIVLTESLKAIVEVNDKTLGNIEIMMKAIPQAHYGALVNGRTFLFGDRSNLSVQFSANERPAKLNVGDSYEPWMTYKTFVYSHGIGFEVKDEFRIKCTRVSI